ncbi:MAG: hypothetical protein OT477_16215 [Chloroflexi bacterium]|nr:hypothetical protein [Chloroflexota bacterium]
MSNPTYSMLLDRFGDVPIPDGYLVIESETALLQHILAEQPWLVRGERLCEWAATFAEGRQLPYQEQFSPTRALQNLLPHLSESAAQAIWHKIPPAQLNAVVHGDLTVWLQTLMPNALWETTPSPQHAAEWLVWLYEQKPAPEVQPLVAAQAAQWQAQIAGDSLAQLYAATNNTAARALLDQWLGLEPTTLLEVLGQFPHPVPAQWQTETKSIWQTRIIQQQGELFTTLLPLPLPLALRRWVASLTVHYVVHNPTQLTRALAEALRPYLSVADQARLTKLLPPPEPAPLPSEPTAVLDWFRNSYWPWRQWQHQIGHDPTVADEAATAFAYWYLREYPLTEFNNALAAHLGFSRTAVLPQEETNDVTLVIIADGLHWGDAAYLREQIDINSDRLQLWEDGLAFTAVPTITEICKPALLAGSPPHWAIGDKPLGQVIPDNQDPAKILRAAPKGSLYFWRVAEPDASYHQQNSSANLSEQISGQLTGLAAKIARLIHEIPAQISLRLILTSDHGRLLASAPRTLSVPMGMNSHGRAALGTAPVTFSQEGFVVDGSLVYLHATRFRLAQDAALPLTSETFQTNDGRGGQDNYPHGGLYPEEVIVPWVAWRRDTQLPAVTAMLTGDGIVGWQGTLTLTLTNPTDFVLTATQLVWDVAGHQRTYPLDLSVEAQRDTAVSIPAPLWPRQTEAKQSTAQVTFQLPTGYAFPITPAIGAIVARAMYDQDDILGDLEL